MTLRWKQEHVVRYWKVEPPLNYLGPPLNYLEPPLDYVGIT